MKIGIIGLGVVGTTLYNGLQKHHKILGYDINPERSKNSFEEVMETDIIFIALPTPLKNGRLDSSFVNECLKLIEQEKFNGLVIIKSTLPIGLMKKVRKMNLRIGYSPEFLRADSALSDFLNPAFILFSGNLKDYEQFLQIFHCSPNLNKIYRVDDEVAELTKLTINAFIATKISFINEIERICSIHGMDAVNVFGFLRADKRFASEYTYPLRGAYGGKCLPKDLQELMNSTKDTYLLEAVHKVNERRKKHE